MMLLEMNLYFKDFIYKIYKEICILVSTMNLKRHNKHWTPNELEKMYREYNLRELTIQEIADLHGRSTYAILNKLVQENLINKKILKDKNYNYVLSIL